MMHPPYSVREYLVAVSWFVCFSVAGVFTAVSDIRWRFFTPLCVMFLVFVRVGLARCVFRASPILPSELFQAELPVHLLVCLYAVCGLFGFARSKTSPVAA